jgi:hypothetical protein
MLLRDRPMVRRDVEACIKVVESIPEIARRYRSALTDLRTAWAQLIGREAMRAAVFEEVHGRTRMWGIGVGVFVHDAFIRELKTEPMFWFGPELAKRVVRGDSPVLSDREVRDANAQSGLNVLVWEAHPIPEFTHRAEAHHLMVKNFLELFRGFRCREAITAQAPSLERLQWSIPGVDSG